MGCRLQCLGRRIGHPGPTGSFEAARIGKRMPLQGRLSPLTVCLRRSKKGAEASLPGVENTLPWVFQRRLRKARLSRRSRNQARGIVRDFAGPSVARHQAVERMPFDSLLDQPSLGEAGDVAAGDDQMIRGAWLRGRGSAASDARRLTAFLLVTGPRPCSSAERRALLAGRRSRHEPDRAVRLLTLTSIMIESVVRVHRIPRSANEQIESPAMMK